MTSPFASLVDAFLQEQYEESPVFASSLGLTAYDERLDDLSAAGFERRRASDWPTQASAYLRGMLEIVGIRERYLRRRGAGPADVAALRAFHDAIAASGSLPTALAERAIAKDEARGGRALRGGAPSFS